MSESVTPKTPEDTSAQPPGKKEALQAIATVLGLTGVLLTGIQYWAVDRFFAQFDVTAEEVGLDTGVLLTRVATALVFMGAMVVPLLLFCPGVLAIGMTEDSNRGRAYRVVTDTLRNHPWVRTLSLSALAGLGWAAIVILEGPSAMLSEGTWAMVWACGAILAAPALHLVGRHRTLGSLLRLCLVVFLVAGLCMILLGNLTEKHGAQAATSARQNTWTYLLGIRLHYVQADFAKTAGSTSPPDGTMLYLGQSNGVHVLYDCATMAVVRKSATQVQLTNGIGPGRERLARSVADSCGQDVGW
ncbi:hypothetical protein ABT354_06335 [Streptomyces sp. NPDC000594]|uniref:hypothetical protein n=1 Tax=Streptomyces sp. NPDC000594 TaxID=3154261 RepID=UPI00331E22D8